MLTKMLLVFLAATVNAFPQSVATHTRGAQGQVVAGLQTDVEEGAGWESGVGAKTTARKLLGQRSPRNLKTYCSGGGDDAGAAKEGQQVEANWEGYGTMYPGEIQKVHKDGSFDVHYDDGFTENRVKAKRVEVEEKNGASKADDPKSDPVCKMQDVVEDIKEGVAKVTKKIKSYVGGLKARQLGDKAAAIESRADDRTRLRDEAANIRSLRDEKASETEAAKAADSPAAATAPSPSAAPTGNKDLTSELEKLKQELTDKDSEIQELETQVGDNDKSLYPDMNNDGPKTVDDLIAEYKARIAKRDERIAYLKAQLKKQEVEVAAREPVSLADVQRYLDDLSAECDKARLKRDELKKQDKLDPELRHSLEEIFRAEEKLRKQVFKFIRMDEKAKAHQEKAQQSKGTKDGTADAEAAEKADKEVLEAAREVEIELHDVQTRTDNLDEGVIPHGEKWWRYRYERSYVEGIIMIIIILLMIIWERLYRLLRTTVYHCTDAEENDMETYGTMYVRWFESCAGELMVSLFVFLTVWLFSQVGVWDYFPLLLVNTEGMHTPTSAMQYRRMAFDLCVVLFVAIIIYFCLIYSIVRATVMTLHDWTVSAFIRAEVSQKDAPLIREGVTKNDAKNESDYNERMGRRWFTKTPIDEYMILEKHWTLHKQLITDRVTAEFQAEAEQKMKGGGKALLVPIPILPPFWKYLRLVVRETCDVLFRFGWQVWVLMLVTFVIFCLGHRYAHVGYIRIMSVVGLINIIFLLYMWYVIQTSKLNADDIVVGTPRSGGHETHINEQYFCLAAHYFMFLMCYGVSRMVCQPWMWELHFWTVLYLSIAAFVFFIIFITVIAPVFPKFAATMSLHMDPASISTVKMLCKDEAIEKRHKAGEINGKEMKKLKKHLRDHRSLGQGTI